MAVSRNPHPGSAVVPVPRTWLIVLSALVIVPWLVVAAIYSRAARAGDAPDVPSVSHPATSGAGGPWGRLTASPIVVSPPIEYISGDLQSPSSAVAWHLPGTSPEVAASFIGWTGMAGADQSRLVNTARPNPGIGGLSLYPDAAFVRGLPAEVRARLYTKLAQTPLNGAQAESYRFLGSSAAEWFAGSPISAETRRLVEPLVYRDGPFLHFADLDLIRSEITDSNEWRLLRRTLMRSSTLLVRLSVESPGDVAALAQYWGTGGRRLDIRPLLESVAGAPDKSIDIIHLLPALARNNLYRYPKLTAADLDRPVLANCLWTALNFFALEPSDRFLDLQASLNALKNDYYVVESGFELGDVVAFLDENGTLFHAAVHLADGLAFTKNGTSPMAPWTIMSIENIRAFYKARSQNARLIYHRRKDL